MENETFETFLEDETENETENETFLNKASIIRLARIIGIQTISNESIEEIRELIDEEIEQIINPISIINKQRQNNTIMTSDIYDALKIHDIHLTRCDNIGSQTIKKPKK